VRTLDVHVDRVLAGTLHEGDDLWRFTYDKDWASDAAGFDLAPGLPRSELEHIDGGTQRPVQWFFDNLLPEERLREAISQEAGIRGEDAFALLQYLGAESAGALTLLPPGAAWPSTPSLHPLSNAALSRRIQGLPRHTLAAQAPKRMSLAGAQHKLLVVRCPGESVEFHEPAGAAPSTHILKPDHPDAGSYPASAVNEYLCMRLARAAGLVVPDVYLHHVPEPVYVIERFDRQVEWRGLRADGTPELQVQRLHAIDACQLLNKARSFKHVGASLDALRQIVDRAANKAHTRLNLYRWLVFNIAIGNDDCHLKNLSFFVRPQGIELAPHYDLLATGAYYTKAFADEKALWPEVPLAIALPGAGSFARVTRQAVIEAGMSLGLPRALSQRILDEVVTRLTRALPGEINALQVLHGRLPREARATRASQLRFLRVLEKIVLAEMLARLRP